MSSVRDIDRGYRRTVRGLVRAGRPGPALTVGVHGDAGGGYPGGATVQDVASYHEFGDGPPQRSWLDAWVTAKAADIDKALRAKAQQVAKGQISREVALEQLGILFVASIQKRMAGGIAPNKADGTPARLINTGQFRSSITHKLE